MKTLRTIADEIGLDKSTVFRYVKAAGISPIADATSCNDADATRRNGVQYYDATAETAIKEHFGKRAIVGASMRNDAKKQEVQHSAMPCNDAQYLATLDTMRKRHKQEVADLESNHAAQIDQLRKHHAEELDRLQDAHKQEVVAMRSTIDSLTADRERLLKELTEERQHSRDTTEKLVQLADQAQRLQLAAMQPPAQIEDSKAKPSLWKRLFGKK